MRGRSVVPRLPFWRRIPVSVGIAVRSAVIGAWDGGAALVWGISGWQGAYPSADPKRKILEDWRPRPATANQALAPTLTRLVSQGRHLDRGTPIFRAQVEGRKAELVGTGISIEPDTGDETLDTILEEEWAEFCTCAGTLGESLWTLQRQASGECDVAGAFLWRALVLPERIDEGLIPFVIQALEVEYLAEFPVAALDDGNRFVRGVEIDNLGRPKWYHIRHPESLAFNVGERVSAAEMQLCYERRRSAQTIGEPRLCTNIERTLQDDELVVSELKSARNLSGMAAIITSDELAAQMNGQDDDGALPPTQIQLGAIGYVPQGTKVDMLKMDRPAQSVREFRGTIRGDLAAGGGTSRVWLDRDGSAYNFANSKFDQIRTQMMVKPAHDWFGTGCASWPYKLAVPWMLAKRGIAWPKDRAGQRRLLRHHLVPDVPPELDEKASGEAFAAQYAQGITSRREYLSSRGKDRDKIYTDLQEEQAMDDQVALERVVALQAKIAEANKADPSLQLHWTHIVTLGGASSSPDGYLKAANTGKGGAAASPNAGGAPADNTGNGNQGGAP